jgi:superfamily I DNA/RNA helicase
MTYKSAKGLDFNSVFVPNLNDRMSFEDGKPLSFSRYEWQRKFLFVALTRSRRDLFLSYHGTPHPYIDEMPKEGSMPFRVELDRTSDAVSGPLTVPLPARRAMPASG